MYYYLYQITNLVNNKIYVGVHTTSNMNDGYMGSGKVIRSAIAKHGVLNFRKDILEYFENAESMYAREREVVTESFLLREDVYNLRRGGDGGFDYINNNLDLVERNTKASRNGRDKKSKTLKNLWESGLYQKRAVNDNFKEAAKTAFLNKKHTAETKEKIKQSVVGKQSGTNNSQYGTMWITDGSVSKKIKNDDIIPDGWVRGRACKLK